MTLKICYQPSMLAYVLFAKRTPYLFCRNSRQCCSRQVNLLSIQAFLHQLQQDVAAVQAIITAAGSPTNEAQTESLVIDPILKSLGYATTDYVKQGFSSAASNFPDYTLLPNNPHKWVLEVKKYGHALKPQDEVQATSYGFHEATDWAVLTNGRTWYIYNIPLKSPSRRVLQIDNLFTDRNALQLLACLSRQGMLQDELTEAWNLKRVTMFVEAEMRKSNSPLRTHLCQAVKQQINLDITDVVMGNVLATIMDDQPTLTLTASSQAPNKPQSPTASVMSSAGSTGTALYTFGDILANPLLGTKQHPKAVDFGDGSPVPVKSWADAAKVVIETIGSKHSLPSLPFTGGSTGKNYFLNVTATHSDGSKMRSHRAAQVGSAMVYIDTHRSVRDMSARLVILLNTINVPLDAARVSI